MLSYHLSVPFFVLGHRADLIVEDFAAPMSSVALPLFTRVPTIAVVQWLFARETSRKYKFPFFLAEELGVRVHRNFVAVSEHMAEELRRRNPRARVDVVYAGVPEMLHASPPCPPSMHEILYLGRLQFVEKGLDLLFDAFARLAAADGAVRLLLAGDGYNAGRLDALVERLGLGGRVEALGRVEGTRRARSSPSSRRRRDPVPFRELWHRRCRSARMRHARRRVRPPLPQGDRLPGLRDTR